MATSPSFTSTPRVASVNVSSANTNRDGTGSPTVLITGVAAGTRITEIVAQAAVTTTAGMIRVFVSVDSGSTYRLYDELPIPAVTVGANTAAARVSRTYSNLILTGTTDKLAVTTHNSESINVVCHGGDLT